jgi:hypothetical protein
MKNDLRFTVWQFVRLMVQLEDSLGDIKTGPHKSLYDRWENIWVDLDAQLLDLGRTDPDGFADLMMEQEVVCEQLSDGEIGIVITELEKVIKNLKNQLSQTENDEEVENFTFERDELLALNREFYKKTA